MNFPIHYPAYECSRLPREQLARLDQVGGGVIPAAEADPRGGVTPTVTWRSCGASGILTLDDC